MKIKDFIKGFKEGQTSFGETISIIINSIIFTLVYVFGIGITSIIAKIFKKNFLEKNIIETATYWQDLNLNKKPFEGYTRQF